MGRGKSGPNETGLVSDHLLQCDRCIDPDAFIDLLSRFLPQSNQEKLRGSKRTTPVWSSFRWIDIGGDEKEATKETNMDLYRRTRDSVSAWPSRYDLCCRPRASSEIADGRGHPSNQ